MCGHFLRVLLLFLLICIWKQSCNFTVFQLVNHICIYQTFRVDCTQHFPQVLIISIWISFQEKTSKEDERD